MRFHMYTRHRRTRRRTKQLLLLLPVLYIVPTYASESTKRGIAYLGDSHDPDNSLLKSTSSPVTWYYNWSPYPASQFQDSAFEFMPLMHGLTEAQSSQTSSAINSLPSSSQHLLSFNEPDGTASSGGSAISPEDAAKAYIKYIVPYQSGKRKWYISHPATTGSPQGLEWLKKFNESCYDIDSDKGCPTDFISAHWYGAFDGLASWLGQLDDFYNGEESNGDDTRLKIWVTEMALPQANADATVSMMNETLPYLDGQDNVEKYAWFGAFRTSDANEWTGDGVALFDKDGGLTDLGALYLGGDANGFKQGQKGEGLATGVRVNIGLAAALILLAITFISLG